MGVTHPPRQARQARRVTALPVHWSRLRPEPTPESWAATRASRNARYQRRLVERGEEALVPTEGLSIDIYKESDDDDDDRNNRSRRGGGGSGSGSDSGSGSGSGSDSGSDSSSSSSGEEEEEATIGSEIDDLIDDDEEEEEEVEEDARGGIDITGEGTDDDDGFEAEGDDEWVPEREDEDEPYARASPPVPVAASASAPAPALASAQATGQRKRKRPSGRVDGGLPPRKEARVDGVRAALEQEGEAQQLPPAVKSGRPKGGKESAVKVPTSGKTKAKAKTDVEAATTTGRQRKKSVSKGSRSITSFFSPLRGAGGRA